MPRLQHSAPLPPVFKPISLTFETEEDWEKFKRYCRSAAMQAHAHSNLSERKEYFNTLLNTIKSFETYSDLFGEASTELL